MIIVSPRINVQLAKLVALAGENRGRYGPNACFESGLLYLVVMAEHMS